MDLRARARRVDRNLRISSVLGLSVLGLPLVLGSCGYSVRALTPEGVRTVSVGVAKNDTFRRLTELPLTRAVVREIQTKTELQVVERERADSVLEISIARIATPVLTEDRADEVTESSVTVTVNLLWKDRRTGQVLMQKNGITESQDFRPPQGENLETGLERAFDGMARRIVEEMEATDW